MLLLAQPLWAVLHINPERYPKAHKDKVRVYTKSQIQKAGSLRAAVINGATGTRNVAVVIVEFVAGNASLISGARTIQSLANINSYFVQMKGYYTEVSYGKLTVNFTFFGNLNAGLGQATAQAAGALTMPVGRPSEYYGCGDEGEGCGGVTTPTPGSVNANGNYLIRDALAAANANDASLTSTNYHDVIVVHAGNGNETSSSNGDIWSIFYSQDAIIQALGIGFNAGITIPETETSGITSPLGVMCHEYGHALGLPDLYNTSVLGGRSVVGRWDLMDSGPFLANGANPGHIGAWGKFQFGWATAQVAAAKGSYSLPYVETASNGTNAIIQIQMENAISSNEYFLVEYRSTTSGATYDASIPGSGLLIWHVDDDITTARGVAVTNTSLANTVNTGTPHYGVSIVPANGVPISNANQGSSGNLYGNNSVFTSPSSDNFNNEPSGASLVNISGIGSATASFEIANLEVSRGQSILRLVSYPNPAGKGYSHPSGEGHATIQFQLSRPAVDYQINLYTLSGDLVSKIPKSAISLNINRSENNKWVYEYNWDLKNGDGETIAPGVYLYLVRADGESKSNKLVIIR